MKYYLLKFKNLLLKPFRAKVTVYDTCEKMPLANFQKYLQTKEVKYFTKELKIVGNIENIIIPSNNKTIYLDGFIV